MIRRSQKDTLFCHRRLKRIGDAVSECIRVDASTKAHGWIRSLHHSNKVLYIFRRDIVVVIDKGYVFAFCALKKFLPLHPNAHFAVVKCKTDFVTERWTNTRDLLANGFQETLETGLSSGNRRNENRPVVRIDLATNIRIHVLVPELLVDRI